MEMYVLVQHWVVQQHGICCPLRATHTEIFIFKSRFTAIVAVAILFVQTAEQKMWLNLKIIRLLFKIELIVCMAVLEKFDIFNSKAERFELN